MSTDLLLLYDLDHKIEKLIELDDYSTRYRGSVAYRIIRDNRVKDVWDAIEKLRMKLLVSIE